MKGNDYELRRRQLSFMRNEIEDVFFLVHSLINFVVVVVVDLMLISFSYPASHIVIRTITSTTTSSVLKCGRLKNDAGGMKTD